MNQFELLFDIRRSVRYHNRRRAFFDRVNFTASMVSLVFGSATIGSLLGKIDPWVGVACAILVSVVSAFNLVMGSSRMARVHHDLARKFIHLEKRLVKPVDDGVLAEITQERLTIEEDEPPVLCVLDSICHNEQARAEGCDKDEYVGVAWYQRLVADFVDLRAHTIHRVSECGPLLPNGS